MITWYIARNLGALYIRCTSLCVCNVYIPYMECWIGCQGSVQVINWEAPFQWCSISFLYSFIRTLMQWQLLLASIPALLTKQVLNIICCFCFFCMMKLIMNFQSPMVWYDVGICGSLVWGEDKPHQAWKDMRNWRKGGCCYAMPSWWL